jgi:HAD superfamily hydrolase (TIGR01549 family)
MSRGEHDNGGESLVGALLDVDGTLVDTNYQHALCWYRAFREHEIVLPVWRLHRHVGMGGDRFVEAVAGKRIEQEHGDEVRGRWEHLFDEVIEEVAPLEGAHDLIAELKERGHRVVLASSAIERHVQHFLDLLDVRELADAWTTNDDVEASKPEPDLVRAALDKAGTDDAVMIGDTPWDIEAAHKVGIGTICLVTGGFSEQELRDAGAAAVFESVQELRRDLDSTALS